MFLAPLLPIAVHGAEGNSHVPHPKESPSQPNILWIYIEDTNDWMSCYGDTVIKTPNIDQLASEGIRFDRAYMTSGVCSPTRSAVITGMYQTSIGAHEHYSSFSVWRGNEMEDWEPNHIGVKTVPEIMHGMNMMAGDFDRDYVIAARDRCDFTIVRIRLDTTDRYKYIRNFMTDKPYMQPNYRSGSELMKFMRDQYEADKLNELEAQFFSDERPAEEFYDLWEDPEETNNRVHSINRKHAIAFANHRALDPGYGRQRSLS